MIFVNAIWIAIDIDLNAARSQTRSFLGHGHACYLAKNALIIIQAHFIFIFAEIVFGLYFVSELVISALAARANARALQDTWRTSGPGMPWEMDGLFSTSSSCSSWWPRLGSCRSSTLPLARLSRLHIHSRLLGRSLRASRAAARASHAAPLCCECWKSCGWLGLCTWPPSSALDVR